MVRIIERFDEHTPLPSITDVLHGLASPDPLVVASAIRNVRFLADIIENHNIPRLVELPGMRIQKLAELTGRPEMWLRVRGYVPSPLPVASSSSTTPPSPSSSDGPSGS